MVLGGVPYGGTVLAKAANPRRELRRRLGAGAARDGGEVRAKDIAARVLSAAHVGVARASGGRVGGRLAGMPVLLLTTRGRRTGRPRTVPLTYFEDGGDLVVVASYGGDDRDPAWYRNLLACPDVEVVVGGERRTMTARPAAAGEKARLWPRIVATHDGYRRYQARTGRDIPLAVLRDRERAT